MWETIVLLSVSFMFILPVFVEVSVSCLAYYVFHVHKTTDSHIYKQWQNEHKIPIEQNNWLQPLKILEDWTWKTQWARQLTPTSTSTCRMNMKHTMKKTTESISTSTVRMNMKDTMNKTAESILYKHWQNVHERRNEQDNWLSNLQALAEWTRKMQWARQLTPTPTSTGIINMTNGISKTTDSHIHKN